MSVSTTGRVWKRSEVAERIVAGDNLVIFRGQVLKIPVSWLNSHPGGALAILHYVGRDATDEIEAFHAAPALSLVQKYSAGSVEMSADEGWSPLMPPVAAGWMRRLDGDSAQKPWIRAADIERSTLSKSSEKNPIHFTDQNHAASEILLVEKSDSDIAPSGPTLATITNPPPSSLSLAAQTRHAKAFRDLHRQIEAAGLYQTPYLTGYGPEILRYIAVALATAVAYRYQWWLSSGVLLGLFWHQVTFTVHDLGHMGVTGDWTMDRIIGMTLASWIGGLSVTWWVDNHNIHHIVTNHPTHDPDIQHIPFFAITPAFFNSLYSSYHNRVIKFDAASRVLLAIQHRMYYIIMSLARFNLYAQSYIFQYKRGIIQGKRGWMWYYEIAGILFYWTWLGSLIAGCPGWGNKLGFLLLSHMAASPVHVQIVLSHFSQSTADLGPTESFPHRQLRTTSDVSCSPSIEFIHGGLHMQVTHHLFPRLPRHNLRAASLLVKQFCENQGLEYKEFKFVDGNREVLGVLRDVAAQVQFMAKVADNEAMEMAGQVDKPETTTRVSEKNVTLN